MQFALQNKPYLHKMVLGAGILLLTGLTGCQSMSAQHNTPTPATNPLNVTAESENSSNPTTTTNQNTAAVESPINTTTGTPSEASVIQMKEFNLQGKIGVKTPQQSGSAFFSWAQQQENFDIQLNGILGVGKTQISGQPGEVTLNSAKTGLIRAATPEELLYRATGWQAPITYLASWVQAQAVTSEAKVQKDDQQRLSVLDEAGWNIQFSYNGQEALPNRLILKQALEAGKENRITMVIQNR